MITFGKKAVSFVRRRMGPDRQTDRKVIVWLHLRITPRKVVWAGKTMTCTLLPGPDPSDALCLPMRTLDILKLILFNVAVESEALVQVQDLSPVTRHHGKLFSLPASASFVRTLEPFRLSVLKFPILEA